MTRELDCRGMACPAPVLKTKEIIDHGRPQIINVLVDNPAAKENVSRFLNSQGFQVRIEEKGNEFCVIGAKTPAALEMDEVYKEESRERAQRIMVMIASDRLGTGDDDLGKKLLANFIRTLKEMGGELWRLVLVNSGVKLTTKDCPVLSDLKQLEQAGVLILVCGTCLDYYQLLEKKQVGVTTNMLDIVTAMQLADKVITL